MPTFQIQFRRDTTANWESCNPVLLLGELGLEFKEDGTRLFKIGDGNTAWTDLPYCSGPKGDKFEFSDFTPEQLEMLKGPKGDAFVYSDFTPAQLAALVGPKGEDGAAPEHKWEGTTLQFKNADGSWGQAVDLKGPKGDTTVSALPIATDSVLGGVKVSYGLSVTADGALSVNKATAAPEAPGETASVGDGNVFALANHRHPKQAVPVASDESPLAPGEASVGTSAKYARADHVHPKQAIPEAKQAIYNTRTVLTTSGTYTAPVDGWYKLTLIGGGGGGAGGLNGNHWAAGGGGGGAGECKVVYKYMTANSTHSFTIGARGSGGGVGAKGTNGGTTTFSGVSSAGGGGGGGSLSETSNGYFNGGKGGGSGDSAGQNGDNGCQDVNENGSCTAPGGNGGGNGGGYFSSSYTPVAAFGYGAGGCGGGAGSNSVAARTSAGSNGYQGCVVLEYYDPAKTA